MTSLNAAKKILLAGLFIITTELFLTGPDSFAQTPNLVFVPFISSGLTSPIDVVNAGDGTGRLFIVERAGRVKIFSSTGTPLGTFLDIIDSTDATMGERGLLSIAFHPDFKNNRYFFIYYTTTAGDIRITRFKTQVGNPDLADEATGTVLLTIAHPGQSNHNGGKLNFGPDGNLYFGTGDGGGNGDPNNNAQNGNSLLGKMLRINVDDFLTPPYYSIPADNPYVASGTILHEIYNMGFRNPWRWSFDRYNGDMWVADVGQSAREEINYTPLASAGGLNYGWRCYEGDIAYNTTVGCAAQSTYFSPIYVYDHGPTGGQAVTGGYVYRGNEFHVMYGYYICADYISQRAWLIKPNGLGGWTVTVQAGVTIPSSIVGFGEAENGVLYALTLTGVLYKITTNTLYLPLTLQQFTAKAFAGYNELRWKTINEQNLSRYEIEFSDDGVHFANGGSISPVNGPPGNNYSFRHYITSFTKLIYRIRIINKDGSSTYSDQVTLDHKEKKYVNIYPTLITDDRLNITSAKPVEQVTFFSAEGKNVFQSRLNDLSGTINIQLPHLQKGFYIVQVKLKDGYVNEKIIIQRK